MSDNRNVLPTPPVHMSGALSQALHGIVAAALASGGHQMSVAEFARRGREGSLVGEPARIFERIGEFL